MGDRKLSGVEAVFARLRSPAEPPTEEHGDDAGADSTVPSASRPPKPAAKRVETAELPVKEVAPPTDTRPTKVRTGRPPGPAKSDKRKVRTTVWADADLLDKYRDWTWERRVGLGELINEALADYYKRTYGRK